MRLANKVRFPCVTTTLPKAFTSPVLPEYVILSASTRVGNFSVGAVIGEAPRRTTRILLRSGVEGCCNSPGYDSDILSKLS